MNQIKRKIEMMSVARIFKHTPQLAINVNAAESVIKHRNVLYERKKRDFSSLNQELNLIYTAISTESAARMRPKIPATIIYVGICWSMGQSPL